MKAKEQPKIEVTTKFNPLWIEPTIHFNDDVMTPILTRVVKLSDEQIRNALIELGWKPPPEGEE